MGEKKYEFLEEVIRTRPSLLKRILKKVFSMFGLAAVFGMGVILVIFLLRDNLKEILLEDEYSYSELSNNKIQPVINDKISGSEERKNISLEEKINKNMVMVSSPGKDELKPTFLCSGVILSKTQNIYVLVPYERVRNYPGLIVKFPDGSTAEATVWNVDAGMGLAALEIKELDVKKETWEKISAASVGNEEMACGTWCVYEGNAQEQEMQTYIGRIAGISEAESSYDLSIRWIYTDLMIQNVEDGFLFDKEGNLTGIVMERNGKSEEQTISALLLYDIYDIVYGMLNKKEIGYVGIKSQMVDENIRKFFDSDIRDGLYVLGVDSKGPAYEAGIMMGDIITEIEHVKVESAEKIRKLVAEKKVGDVVLITLYRKMGEQYEKVEVSILIGKR